MMKDKFLICVSLTCVFLYYFAYVCMQEKNKALDKAFLLESEIKQFEKDTNSIKELEVTILEAIKDASSKTDSLRNDVDAGLVELRVKVDASSEDSRTARDSAVKALRLTREARQDYYNLRDAISYNKMMLEGWQSYYCKEIAPKNGTLTLCSEVN